MSHVVKEPTFILGYCVNKYLIGIYEISKSINKDKIEKMLEQHENMSLKEKVRKFDLTERQANEMIFKMVSIYPKSKDIIDLTSEAEPIKDEELQDEK